MFQFSGKLKTLSIILMVIGVISLGFSFFGGGGEGHHQAENTEEHSSHAKEGHHGEQHSGSKKEHAAEHGEHSSGEAHSEHGHEHKEEETSRSYHKTSSRATEENNDIFKNEPSKLSAADLHHQQQNRPWVNLLTSNFFFLAIALGALFFLAVQYVAQVGWSVAILRVMEAMSTYIWIPMVIMGIIAVAGVYHLGGNHMWHWLAEGITDPDSKHYDKIIAGKSSYLNGPFFLIRYVLYALIWIGGAVMLRKMSKKMDMSGVDYARNWSKMRNFSAVFLILFGFTSTAAAWDWIMSIDTHWFSTLFGWYVFAGMFISGLVTMLLITLYLKRKGYLEEVNNNHLHDLGKFTFAFSIFWTYLWFAQYMLIWYANKPEEATYFMVRFAEYKPLLLGMLFVNFVFPVVVLMSRDAKRNYNFLMVTGLILIIGHWVDVFLMVAPGTMGANASIGLTEIGTFLGFAGLFIFVTFSALTKVPLVAKNHPMYLESKYHHI